MVQVVETINNTAITELPSEILAQDGKSINVSVGGNVTVTAQSLSLDTTALENKIQAQTDIVATQTTLALIKAKTDNIDVALSTRTKSSDTQTISGTVTANAGTNLNTSLLALETGGTLTTIAGKDFATQTTLSGLDTRIANVITDHNMIGIESHYVLAAEGSLANHIPGSRIGSSSTITTGAFVILANATVIQPTVGQAMNVVSTSASDSSAGTGVQQITIDYFTTPASGWIKKSIIVTLDGTTPVTTAEADIYRIDRVHSNRVGSGGFAVGTITIKDTTNTLLFSQIDVGNNVFERAIHYIPNGYQCVLSDMMVGISSGGGVIFRVFTTEEDASGNTVTIGQLSIEMNGPATIDRSFNLPVVISNLNGKNKSIGIAVKSRTGTQTATGTIRFMDQLL